QWGRQQGQARIWRDLIEVAGATEVVATFDDGHPAIVRRQRLHYLAAIFDEPLLRDYLASVAKEALLPVSRLDDGMRISRRGDLTYVFNYGDVPLDAPHPPVATFVIGGAQVPPQGVSVFQV
ncbi:MAG: beta-galactosidase, partial [Janthinobacterium sp.]